MRQALVISSIRPSKTNNGEPSGLLGKIVEFLHEHKYEVTYELHEKITLLNKLSFFSRKRSLPKIGNTDLIIFYPFYMIFSYHLLPQTKTLVFGPDSNSLVWKRRARVRHIIIFKRLAYYLVSVIFLLREKSLSSKNVKHIVVGENDYSHLIKNSVKNVYYLTHPVLENYAKSSKRKSNRKFVISGFYNKDMLCRASVEEINKIKSIDTIIICGKRNKWIGKYFKEFKIEFIPFIEDYAEICNPNIHIHICPISYGGGTKNRVLSALHFGALVFGTEISNENIRHKNLYKISQLKDIDRILPIRQEKFGKNLNKQFINNLIEIIN